MMKTSKCDYFEIFFTKPIERIGLVFLFKPLVKLRQTRIIKSTGSLAIRGGLRSLEITILEYQKPRYRLKVG